MIRTRRLVLGILSLLASQLFLVPGYSHAQIDEESQRYRLARGYEEASDWVNAGRVYKELYDGDPNSNAYYEGLVRSLMAQSRYTDLAGTVDERARRYPRDVELQAFAAALQFRIGRPDDARRRWTALLAAAGSGSENIWGTVARNQLSVGAIDDAIETWREGRKMLRSRDLFSEELGSALGMAGRIEEATSEYLTMLEFGSARLVSIEASMARFLVDPVATRRAVATVSSACNERRDYQPFVELLGWLYQELGDDDGGFAVAVRLDSLRRGNGAEVFRFADRMLSQDRYDPALRALEYFRSTYPPTNPLSAVVALSYVRALELQYRDERDMSRERATALVERYREFAGANGNTTLAAEALVRVIELLDVDLSAPADALETAYRVVDLFPDSPFAERGRLAVGRLLIRLGDLPGARAVLDSLITGGVAPGSADVMHQAVFLRGEIDFFAGDFDKAQDVFVGLTNDPTADVANDALEYGFLLTEYSAKQPKGLREYANGMLLLRQMKWEAAVAGFGKAISVSGGSGLADRAQFEQGRAYERAGNGEQAVRVWMDLVDRHPQGLFSDRALLGAADVTERLLNDRARALTLYLRLMTDYDTSPLVEEARQAALRIRAD